MKNRTAKPMDPGPTPKAARYITLPPDLNPKKVKELGMIGHGVMAESALQRYNKTPFRNNAIDLFDRKRYDISREFDGKEVEGTLMERPTVGGGRLEVERFNMPGGGRRVERTRYNAEGVPVKRTIKDRKIN